jgi:dTDP-4-amino-4,6-dideoxygalactose transaminase
MVLKQAYLGGAKIEKDDFRKLFIEGETHFDKVGVTGMSPVSQSLMAAISQKDLRNRRLENFTKFKSLGAVSQKNFPELGAYEDSVPFSIVLLLEDRARRDFVREQLIQRRVYPAVLWDLANQSDTVSNDFASRMLSLPCDFRYDENDLSILGQILKSVLYEL